MNYNIKSALFVLAIILFFSFCAGRADASLISITEKGRVMVKVLSAETSGVLENMTGGNSDLEVTKVRNINMIDPSVGITKKDGKISLLVMSEGSFKELDVTNVKDDLIEIEQRPNVQRMTVSADDAGFNLKQGSFVAVTQFPVEVDATSAKMSVTTPRGKEYVTVFPIEAVESTLRSGLVTKITNNNMEIKEGDNGLTYNIHGEKIFNILNLTEFKIPLDLSVSLSDGKIVSVDSSSPIYKIIRVFVI